MNLERCVAAKSAKSVFFEDVNDIDIYVEDTAHGYEKLARELFSRVFEGVYKVKKVFPLGERAIVVNECGKNQTKVARPTLYVVDGDLHLLTNDDPADEKKLNGLYKLPCYCIENILIDEQAITKLLHEEDTVNDLGFLRNELKFEGWIACNDDLLVDLFMEYGAAKKLAPHLQTVRYSVRKLISSADGTVDEVKIRTRAEELRSNVVTEVGEERYLEIKRLILTNVKKSDKKMLKFVSGKDYLLPLLILKMKSVVATKISNINLKIRLAMHCDVSILSDAGKFILH